jgi:hypothetical protein
MAFRRAGIFVLGLLLMSGAAAAKVTRYECSFDGNWMPSVLVIETDDAAGTIKVFDEYIKAHVGTPIDGKLSAETKARTSFSWRFRATSDTRQQTTLDYQLTYYKDGRPAKLNMIPRGYRDNFTTNGACKVSSRG